LLLASALFCALAFNLVFFVQELLLTLPKAFVPGVHVRLYHNNHTWTGDAPVLPLLQGTGTVADLTLGLVFALWFGRSATRSTTTRLFLFWMAFQGFYQGLSQIVIGAFLPGNDAGLAMGWLGLRAMGKDIAAAVSLLAMIAAGFWLTRQAIARLATTGESTGIGARLGFIFRAVSLPALLSVLLLIPFREPRNMVEVAILPLIVMVSGILWIQFGAGFASVSAQPARPSPSLLIPFAALLLVLAFFQLLLRPGIAFS
jgi:hypothetical protein